jgi:hypothetical protein
LTNAPRRLSIHAGRRLDAAAWFHTKHIPEEAAMAQALSRWQQLLPATLAVIGALALPTSASAVMLVDSVTLFRDGTLANWLNDQNKLLDDDFTNGDPLHGPLYNGSTTEISTYQLSGGTAHPELLTESGGLLRIDPALADTSANAQGGVGPSARLRLLTNTTDPNRGLPLSRSFAAAVTLSLSSVPSASLGQAYGMRLADNFSNGDDVLELSLLSGNRIQFRRQDFVAGAITNYGTETFSAPATAAGLVLALLHTTPGNATIQAAYGFVDGTGELIGGDLTFFSTTAEAFHGEVHTRLELRATQPVPEPSSFAMLAAGGAAMLLFARRRRNAG